MIKQMDKILLINLGKANMAILWAVFITFKLFLNKTTSSVKEIYFLVILKN